MEKGNEAALIELEALRGLKEKRDTKVTHPTFSITAEGSAQLAKPRKPISLQISASIQELPPEETLRPLLDSIQQASEEMTSVQNSASSSWFATLRKSRDSKKTFVTSSPNGISTSTSRSTLFSEPPSAVTEHTSTPSPSTTKQPNDTTQRPEAEQLSGTRAAPHSCIPPPDPDAPGAPLLFLRRLSALSSPQAWSLLSSYPPASIPRLLAPVLEPDILGQVLLALHYGAKSDTTEARDAVRTIMEGLKSTPRWRMNAAMLSRDERSAGEEAWAVCGAKGAWP